jgi:hypothetical protein
VEHLFEITCICEGAAGDGDLFNPNNYDLNVVPNATTRLNIDIQQYVHQMIS